jgi:hypothetical protein
MTRDLPTPSPRLDRRCLLLAMMCSLGAHAHETAPEDGHALRPILTAGVRYLDAEAAWPAARLPGVLESGNLAAWETGLAEDYADIGLQADWRQWRALVKGSWHGPDGGNDFAVEQAWLRGHFEPAEGMKLAVRGGRMLVPFGRLNQEHAHNQDFGVQPLIFRAVTGEGWRDDGLEARWTGGTGWFAGGGVYAGDSFPGANASGPGAWMVNAGWERDTTMLMLSIARLEADGRPTRSARVIGHSHGQAVCHAPVANEVCLEGESLLGSVAVAWSSGQWPVAVAGEAWAKRETGDLFSPGGNTDYVGTLEGGWLTATWRFHPGWQALLRGEGMTASHDLNGPGAALVATDAGLGNADHALSRLGAGLTWQPDAVQRISLELHREDTGNADNRVLLARYQVDLGALLGKH